MSVDRSELSEHDLAEVEAFEKHLQMAGDLSDRWGCSTIEAIVWLTDEGYTTNE